MNKDFFTQLNSEIEEFKTHKIRIADGYEFNQRERVHSNIRMYNSQFEGGKYDSEGFIKYFKNIVRNPCNSAAKAIKFKPSDILLSPSPGQSSLIVWLMNLDLRYWFKTKKFNRFLNRLFRDIPIMGSVVIKKVLDEFHFVDLRNLVNEQSADNLKQATYIIEQHYYSINELRQKKGLWENTEQTIDEHRSTQDKYIRVLERWGEVPEDVVKKGGNPEKYVYAQAIAYSPDKSYYDGKKPIASDMQNTRGQILFAKEKSLEEFPYREFHWEKIPGRWLGVSRIELLQDPQVRTNEITNLRVKSSYFAALNVFQSRDDTFKKNLLKEVANGDVLSIMDRIERIPTEERNLAAFDLEERGWAGSRDENSFNYDIVRGERMPAGTPLGSAQMAAAMITSYFEQIQEDIASEIKELIYNDIIPGFKKQKEHYIKLVGEDLDKYHKVVVEYKLVDELMRFLKNKKRVPNKVQYDAIKQILMDRKKKEDIKAPDYSNVKYNIDIVITGQDKDLRMQATNMAMVLQAIQQDQTVLTDPAKRKVFGKLLDSVGININEIDTQEERPIERQVQEKMGGGISRPSMPTTMQMGSPTLEV